MGHFPSRREWRTAGSVLASTRVKQRGRTCRANIAANLRRIIVTQGDTEPASVEQQRHLGLTAPSMYDPAQLVPGQRRRGASLVGDGVFACIATSAVTAVRKPKHCWIAAQGDDNNPRILGAFNERTPDGLAFFMFTYFTDRDGKFQLSALAESGFDPLARTTKFMLTEEAHHMFVGEIGRLARDPADRASDERTEDRRREQDPRGGCDRPWDAPALSELPLLGHYRSVRCGSFVECRDLL